ncbi:MAG TPA: sulfite exporter TauE/SafE family protein [Longimicrobium sp.]|uniref:sulfite exporter TauE/SafE family protein n=1 Tax=Longimicrobium sp. TaxID=2029185 RepID=UPI002ED8741E
MAARGLRVMRANMRIRRGAGNGWGGAGAAGALAWRRSRRIVSLRSAVMGMLLVFLLIGLAAGVLSGLFGIGGGILIVPALMLVARMQPLQATGTSLGALLLPVGALGAYEYYRNGNVNVAASLTIAVGLLVGAYFGAHWAQTLSPVQMKRAFAVFLVAVAIRMWLSAK